jgi:hypothetical protein
MKLQAADSLCAAFDLATIAKLSCHSSARRDSEHHGLSTARLAIGSLSNDICACIEAGSNVEFSRHAARKPMIARYRRMPRGRLQFLVGRHGPTKLGDGKYVDISAFRARGI